MGNNYYRKDDDGVAIGIAQSDTEHEDYLNNWSLYNAIPGTTQIMRAYFLPTLGDNWDAMAKVMEFTNNDTMPKLEGHYAMAAHFHWDAARQWQEEGIDWRIDDADAMREALSNVTVNAPVVPLIANVLAAPITDPEEIKKRLVEQVTGTVRWIRAEHRQLDKFHLD
jgi:hypothetical protein